MKTTKTIRMILCAVVLSGIIIATVWAAYPEDSPEIDGYLYESEYDTYGPNTGYKMPGNYGTLFTKYVDANGLFICNDWWNAEHNYDPDDECDGVNEFVWTDWGANPVLYWKVKVHGDGTIEVFNRERGDPLGWGDPIDIEGLGWEQATGYHDSPCDCSPPPCQGNHEVNHPIWELLIPREYMSSNIIVGLVDPKFVDPENCGTVSWGSAPSFRGTGAPYTGGC